MSTLTKHEYATIEVQQVLPKICQDPDIFYVQCTIGNCTFADFMLDLGTSINLANRSVVQPLGFLEDVLVQVIGLIFLADFCVLDMEDKASRKGSMLILG
ncbi:hypothetical protein CR513_21079, partial [Mucuna pruriens]